MLLWLVLLLTIRFVYVIFHRGKSKPFAGKEAKTLVVIGSGGHTTEMLRQMVHINPKLYRPRLYVMADSDTSSETKIIATESHLNKDSYSEDYKIKKLPRSRRVNQSYISSIFTTAYSTLKSIPLVMQFKPDLILCNGPGTCIPICLIALILNILFITNTRIVYIESICRVKTLSLSGKILLPFADKVLVQWPQLNARYPTTTYLGRL